MFPVRTVFEDPYFYFSFPFNRTANAMIKILGGKFIGDCWRIKASWNILKQMEDQGFQISLDRSCDPFLLAAQEALKQGKVAIPDTFFNGLPLKPYAHQKQGVAFLANKKCGALWWEMGTGKSKTVLDLIRYKNWGKVLVVCPASVISQWEKEVGKHLPEAVTYALLGTRKKKMKLLRLGGYGI